jgi:predicted dehydrogenase
VALTVAQPQRFCPYAQAIRQAIDAGKLGVPGLVRLHHWNGRPPSRAGTDVRPLEAAEIVADIDVASWLMGMWPESIYAAPIDFTAPDRGLVVHCGFATGGMAVIDCQQHGSLSGSPYYSLSLIGSSGAAYADDHHNVNLWLKQGIHGLAPHGAGDEFAGQLQSFIEQLQQRQYSTQTAREYLWSLAAAEAAVGAAATGRLAVRSGDGYELC